MGMFRAVQWAEGKRHGTGVYTNPAEDRFVGQFEKGEIVKGSRTSKGGDVYQGPFVHYLPSGEGTTRFANGDLQVSTLFLRCKEETSCL